MSVVVLDYSGHPCQVQLSRVLARRGHRVTHLHCPGYTSGKGDLELHDSDAPTLQIDPVGTELPIKRYLVWTRLKHEVAFPRDACAAIRRVKPDVVLISNVPLLALYLLTLRLRMRRIPYVFWQQDVYSRALAEHATRRFGRLGPIVAAMSRRLEAVVATKADAIVPISDAFLATTDAWGVPREKTTVIGNWAALDEMPVVEKQNDWAVEHGLSDRPVALYAGTVGLKHDPAILLDVARALATDLPEARMVVVSQGYGREWLEAHGAGIEQLVLLDYQAYDVLPAVLGTGDVLLTLLEPDAGEYSVPSKVLNYLCAGRPIVGVMPLVNGAAQMITGARAGEVFAGRGDEVSSAVLGILTDPGRGAEMGRRARSYAELHFDADAVTDRFETTLDGVVHRGDERGQQ